MGAIPLRLLLLGSLALLAALTTSASGASISACAPASVVASFGYGAASGEVLGGVALRNVSRRSCLLPARPRVRLLWRHRAIAVKEVPLRRYEPDVGQHATSRLRPGGWAFAAVYWSNWCGRRPWGTLAFAPRISVGLARGVSIAARLRHPRRLLTPRCDQPGRPSLLEIGRFYTPLPKGWVA